MWAFRESSVWLAGKKTYVRPGKGKPMKTADWRAALLVTGLPWTVLIGVQAIIRPQTTGDFPSGPTDLLHISKRTVCTDILSTLPFSLNQAISNSKVLSSDTASRLISLMVNEMIGPKGQIYSLHFGPNAVSQLRHVWCLNFASVALH